MTNPSTPTPGGDPTTEAHLETGRLGRASLVSLSLASFFPAVGIALVPLLVFSTAGTNAWQASLLSTIAVICVGRAVTAFARRYVATGSLYSYIGEVFGPWARYLTAAALLAGFIAAIGALAAVVGIFAGSFLLSHGVDNALSFGPQLAIFLIALALAAAIAYRGLDTSVWIAVTLAVLSFPLVLVITVASAAKTGLDLADQFSLSEFSLSGTLQGMAVGAAFLVGFESCTALAAETRNPRRNVPLAVMSVPVLLGGLFPLVTVLQVPGLQAASAELEAGMSAPAALALHAGLGSGVATASDLVLAVATFAALIGFINYGARFAMTLAGDGILPAPLGKIHPRHHSPFVSIAVMSVAGLVLVAALVAALVFTAGDVVSAYYTVAPLVVYLWVLPYVLITIGAIVLTVRAHESRPFLIGTSVFGAVATAWMYINGVINPPPSPANAMSWVVLIVLVVLLAVFAITKRRAPSAAVEVAPQPAAVEEV
ncbi:APC family permease [Rhodococcus sp. T2V]|uniref:APC family permease n=1 Tax=Rhodococcus sp. T2V TaxID=3034164 RepID=UPI0023E29857|nr:APC family permease [Rhodococcus sp. T2V]MDF3304230.1 APC family permease [Rhodococcus sp. T2V]